MLRFGRLLIVHVVAALALALNPMAIAAGSSTMGAPVASIQPWLSQELARTSPTRQLTVQVHGTDLRAARSAVLSAGMVPLREFARIDVAVASGTPAQVRLAARQSGVTYVEGNQPIEFHLDTSHEATQGDEFVESPARSGTVFDGTGVSVAVIDTGIDPTHPFFTGPDGESIVVANLKNMCGVVISQPDNCFVDAGPLVDTDTASVGGHGTHVNGIVAGQVVELADGAQMRGAAPGASLVSLSMGAGIAIINAHLGLEWVLQHHAAPCGADVSAEECPPIRAVNNSYGPVGGGEFNAESATAKFQRALAEEGVVTVWSNGNDGGEGLNNRSNPAGQDPTPGIISVASYFDEDTGTRDGTVSAFSSRGDSERSETWPDISAPGQNITSSCRPYLPICSTGRDPRTGAGPADIAAFNTISGTSMAAPHISGIVAQLFQSNPDATPAEVEHALKSTAYRYADGAAYASAGDYTSSYDKGAGLVDVAAAINALNGWSGESEAGTPGADGELPAVNDAEGAPADAAGQPESREGRSSDTDRESRRESGGSEAGGGAGTAADAKASASTAEIINGLKADTVDAVAVASGPAGGSGESGFARGSLIWIGAVFALLAVSAWYFAGARRT